MPLESLLKQYFGFTSFRGCQREVIQRIIGGQHALIIMPTGMGKSLCYQIPAIHFAKSSAARTSGQPVLTLVISPLIALMKDQVDALLDKGVSATFVNSSLDRQQRLERYAEIAKGRYDILYVTPERFRKPEFVELIQERQIELLAVDEAHCISQWGHDFRPDYTRLGEIRSLLGQPTTIALTATATPDVQEDIVAQLGISPGDIELFHEGIDRPNLTLSVEHVWGDDEKIQFISNTNHRICGAGIVYFTLIRTLERFSQRLRQMGAGHLVYHGDLDRHRRRQVQELFMSDDHLVLATNAFGMGIDKESIRFVIHAELPGSMESYYQEIGRAGRDGLPSECTLLYDHEDLETQMEFMRWSNPDGEFYRRVYDFLKYDAERIDAFGHDWLKEKLHFKQRHDHRLDTALAMLDRYGIIEGRLSPLKVRVVAELHSDLGGDQSHATKLRRDQQKLLTLVQYANHDGDLKQFIHDYFGLPYQPKR